LRQAVPGCEKQPDGFRGAFRPPEHGRHAEGLIPDLNGWPAFATCGILNHQFSRALLVSAAPT